MGKLKERLAIIAMMGFAGGMAVMSALLHEPIGVYLGGCGIICGVIVLILDLFS